MNNILTQEEQRKVKILHLLKRIESAVVKCQEIEGLVCDLAQEVGLMVK